MFKANDKLFLSYSKIEMIEIGNFKLKIVTLLL